MTGLLPNTQGGHRVAAGGGSPVTLTYVTSGQFSSYVTDTATETGVSIGTAFSTRRVVVAIGGACIRNFSSATIGGVTATLEVERRNSGDWAVIISADVPTGTTADIAITVSANFVFNDINYHVYTLDYDLLDSDTPNTGSGFGTSSTTFDTDSITSVADGCILAACGCSNGASKTITFSDDDANTYNTDIEVSENSFSNHANAIDGGAVVVTATSNISTAMAIAAAAWK